MTNPLERLAVQKYPGVAVVARGAAPPPPEALARITREAERQTVIVAADPPLQLPELVQLLADHLPVGCRSVRLVLSRAGRPEVAQELAERLRVEVVAPTGRVLLLPSGMLFATDDGQPGGGWPGGWYAFRPGAPVAHAGARHPAPEWQAVVPTGRLVAGGLRLTSIPAGLWLHESEPVQIRLDGLISTIPVLREAPSVLVGRAGDPPLDDERAYAALAGVAQQLRRLTLIPYGPDSVGSHRLAERLADGTGATVDVVGGAPHTASNGGLLFLTVGPDGSRGWRPFGERFRYRAGSAPQVVQWRPVLSTEPVAAATERLVDDWRVEIVRAGWWLHRAGDDSDAESARRVPADATRPLLVLSASAMARPAVLPSLVGRLQAALPPEVGSALGLVCLRPPAIELRTQWLPLIGRYAPVLVVSGDGDLAALTAVDRVMGRAPVVDAPDVEPAVAGVAGETAKSIPPGARANGGPLADTRRTSAFALPAVTMPTRAPGGHHLIPENVDTGLALHAGAEETDLGVSTLTGLLAGAPYRGPLLASWQPAGGRWQVGTVYRAREVMGAVPAPGAPPASPAPIAVWSITGRRPAANADAAGTAVFFAPGSRFVVLEMYQPDTVLLRELPPPAGGVPDDSLPDAVVRRRLHQLLTAYRRAPSWLRSAA